MEELDLQKSIRRKKWGSSFFFIMHLKCMMKTWNYDVSFIPLLDLFCFSCRFLMK